VEEVPVDPPDGAGTHLWLWVEKRGLSSEEVAQELARTFQLPRRAVAHAGRKDVHAVTRQWFSLEGGCAERARVAGDSADITSAPAERWMRVLAIAHHPRGLRPGQSRGNRFRLLLRAIEPEGFARIARGLQTLVERGVPAWYGEQRQGHGGRNGATGLALLRGDCPAFAQMLVGAPHPADFGRVRAARDAAQTGDFAAAARLFPASFTLEQRAARELAGGLDPALLPSRLARRELQFLVAAAQADLFDRALEHRFPHLSTLLLGDIAHLHASRGSFLVEDSAREQPRADRFEISPTAPLPGRRLRPAAAHGARELERAVLAERGLDDAAFDRPMPSREGPWRVDGARRPLRWPLAAATLTALGPTDAELCFQLPPGAYATEVLAELCTHPEGTATDSIHPAEPPLA